MFNEGKLWKERFAWTSKELGRYLRYIFTGHLIIVFIFLLGTAAFYYQEYVKTLTADFPIAIIMGLVIGLALTHSPIFTFLREADRIFLLPLETKLSNYFKKSIAVSFFVQLYVLLIILAVFMPMYVKVYSASFNSFFTFLLVIAVMKLWNLLVRWQILYFVETDIHAFDSVTRYVLNVIFLYFLFTNSFIVVGFSIVVMVVLFVIYQKQTVEKGLKWEYLIDLEEKRMTSFYRIANLFTDVPKFKDRVKRRRWLDWLLGGISFRQNNTFSFLYLRTFLRAGDYFGLVIRLTVIGAIALYLVSFGYGQILIVLLFIYLTGFQLLPLANHHQNKIWISLYPVDEEWKIKSFQKLLLVILLAEGGILSLVLAIKGEFLISLSSLAAAIVFTFYFVYSYMKNRLKAN